MAAKKQVVDKDTNQISDVPDTTPEVVASEPQEVAAPIVRQAGTVIKTYLQNGLRYNRVVQDDGVSTLDIRA